MNIVMNELKTDPRVDKQSLNGKISLIEKFKCQQQFEQAKDHEAELCGAYHLLKLSMINKLIFDETPDVLFYLREDSKFGMEVKRTREKPPDEKDEKRMLSDFVRYGKPRYEVHTWSEYVEKDILEKASKSYSTGTNTFLFLRSDSSYQIEKPEIEDGIVRAINFLADSNPFIGIFYETVWRADNSVNVMILKPAKMDRMLMNALELNDHFSIK